jgi:cell division protein FtsB
MFETRAEEDRGESIKLGRYVTKDVDYALITPHGSKDQIDRVASEWLDKLDADAREGRIPRDWAKAFRHAYDEWKAGHELPTHGTPIANWPLVTPSQVKNLRELRVMTVEVLAEANEEVIRRLGMGGRDLVAKAKEYLKQAAGPGQAAAQITALEQKVADLTATVEQLSATNQMLAAQAKQIPTPLDPAAANPGISSSDLFDSEPAPARPGFTKL